MMTAPLAFYPLALGMPGPGEWFLIAIAALLIFGKRLPEVGRSLGQGIVEFKKGLKGVGDEVASGVNNAGNTQTGNTPAYPQQPQIAPPQQMPTSYKFDPHTGKPIEGRTFEQPVSNHQSNQQSNEQSNPTEFNPPQ